MFILDRFEGESAIIEVTEKNGAVTIIKADISMVSPETSEGDVLICENGIYTADKEETKLRKRRIYERLRNLRK